MGRSAQFDKSSFLRTAVDLLARNGPDSVGVLDIAKAMGAPTGSFYHRYPSRAEMLGDVWMTVVEDFQAGFLAALLGEDALAAAKTAALHTVGWANEKPRHAAVLLFSSRRNFERDAWSAALKARERKARRMLETGLGSFIRRVYGRRAGSESVYRVKFALIDAPGAAIRPFLESRTEIPPYVTEIIANNCEMVLNRRKV